MIKLFSSLPSIWYERVNQSTGIVSALVFLAFVSLEYIWHPLGGNEFFGFTLLVGLVALVHALYAFFGFRRISPKSPKLAIAISFGLYTLMSFSLLLTTRELGTQYVGVWIITLLMSGMFGWFILAILTTVNVVYFLLLGQDILSASDEYNAIVLLITSFASIVSFLLWKSLESHTPTAGPQRVKSKGGSDDLDVSIIIDSIAEGVVLIDSEGTIRVFNPAAQQITGWEINDAIGLNFKSVLVLTDKKRQPLTDDNHPIITALQSTEIVKQDDDVLLTTKSKASLLVSMVLSPILNKENVPIAAVVVFRDVTQERQAEQQRAEFISTASHEMRTPVAAIEGYLALALNDKVSKIDSKARSYLEKAHSSTQHLGKLFQDLLTAAKSEDGRLSNHPQVVEAGKFLEDLTESVRFTAEKKNLLVEFDYGGGARLAGAAAIQSVRPLAYIHVDPGRIREVLINLFDNATKYTEEGRITIGLQVDPENVVMSIADTGAGIPAEDVPHLFQKFYRVDNTATRQVGGTGLGLFIAKKIVELYNGRIWVESEVNKGSKFYISIPRISAEKAKQLLTEETANKSPLQESVQVTSDVSAKQESK